MPGKPNKTATQLKLCLILPNVLVGIYIICCSLNEKTGRISDLFHY